MTFAKKVVMGALIVAPLLFVPTKSQAGILSDIISWLNSLDKDGHKKDKTSNSVPVNGGLVVLMVVGAGLGVKMIVDKNKAAKEESVSI
jgi:hypothetical protein